MTANLFYDPQDGISTPYCVTNSAIKRVTTDAIFNVICRLLWHGCALRYNKNLVNSVEFQTIVFSGIQSYFGLLLCSGLDNIS